MVYPGLEEVKWLMKHPLSSLFHKVCGTCPLIKGTWRECGWFATVNWVWQVLAVKASAGETNEIACLNICHSNSKIVVGD